MKVTEKGLLTGLVFFLLIISAASASTDTLQVLQMNQKAWSLKFASPDSSEILLNQSFQLAQKLNYLPGQAEALKMKGILAHIRGKLDLSFDYALQSFDIYSRLNQSAGMASCLSLMGIVQYSRGKYPEALSHYFRVLKIYEDLSDSINIAKVFNNIGSAWYKQEEDEKALEFYNKSYALYTLLGNEPGKMEAINNIGMVLMEEKRYQEALENYRTAVESAMKHGNKKLLSHLYQNMAICFRYQNDLKQAKIYYEKSWQLKKELNDTDGMCSSLTGLAILSRLTGNPRKAIELGMQVLETSQQAELLDRTNGAYEIIYQSYSDLKDFEKAYTYYLHFSATKDSLVNLEKTRQIGEIQTRYETEKKEQKILLLTKEAEIQSAIKNRAIIVSVLLAVVLILGAYGFRLKTQNARIRNEKLQTENQLKEEENLRLAEELKSETEINRVQSEKHQLELDHKNREMTSAALYAVQRNELLSDLKEKMTPLTEDKTMKEVIKPLLKIIETNLALDNDWENLKIHFDQVHPGFFQKLQLRFPELTQTELRHIAYMKINLSSKEIARLLNIGVKGIQMSRYRIKKKMGLPEEVNLVDFIQNLASSADRFIAES